MHGMMPMVFLVLSEREHSPVAGVQRPSPVTPGRHCSPVRPPPGMHTEQKYRALPLPQFPHFPLC